MKMTKKVISFMLVLSMVFGLCSIFSSAAAPDSAIDLYVDCDKTSYMPGDIVTFTVSEQVADVVGPMWIGGTYSLAYNSNVIQLLADTQTFAEHNFEAIAGGGAGFDEGISTFNDTLGSFVNEEQSTAYGWNKTLDLSVGDTTPAVEFDATEKTPVFKFQMKIAEDAPDGDYVFGWNISSYENDQQIGFSNAAATEGTYGLIPDVDAGTDFGYGCTYNYGFNNCTIKVSSAAEGPKVAKSIAQVKFTYDNSTLNGVADAFKFRVKSVITAQDWNDYFANTAVDGATKNMITAVGMVAFPAKVDGTDVEYNADTAKEAALAAISSPNRQGQVGNYKAASTTYIQKANDASDAYFGAIIDTSHTNCQEDIKYVGFVQYVDNNEVSQIIFYDAVCTATVASQYGQHVEAFKNL